MAPTFNDGQVIIIDKKVDPHALCVGDVVIFRDPEQSKESKDVLVKRIYALGPKRIYVLPTIRMSNPNEGPIVTGYQIVQFHGSDYDRQRAFDGRLREYDVQVDQVFVTGDNPPESEDSRVFGAVKIEDIRGVVLWPNTRRT
jgi:signal peptidase I